MWESGKDGDIELYFIVLTASQLTVLFICA